MTHGWRRDLFVTGGHKFGVFICYESIFGDEVRLFAKEGADVFVNISDDGWYGDTSAPWQHLNMARMRAIENRRWLLRDTDTGVTTVIDPYGRLTASAPRHIFTVARGAVWLPQRQDVLHGAWQCVRPPVWDNHFIGASAGWRFLSAAQFCLVGTRGSDQHGQFISNKSGLTIDVARSRIRLHSRSRKSPRPAGVSLTLPASAKN